jgi:predicted  nucleic acid-binding Zn-ribbon protein
MDIEKMEKDLKDLTDGLKSVNSEITRLQNNSIATQGAIMYLDATIKAEKAKIEAEKLPNPTPGEPDNIVEFPVKKE